MKRKIFLLPLICSTLFSLIGCNSEKKDSEAELNEEGMHDSPVDTLVDQHTFEHYKYSDNVVLIKAGTQEEIDEEEVTSIKSIGNSNWYSCTVKEDTDIVKLVKKYRQSKKYMQVDFDYLMEGDGDIESSDVASNPQATQQTYLETQGICDAWNYHKDNDSSNPKLGGGDSSVVVAVIDTGVDYNHIDLRDNIWVNTDEIPDNGIDDDGNGYIDDVRGWNCVGNNKDPMDDNGHGTHVAGIIAAENNTIGTVGVAYNCKIMPLKAGTSSGTFLNSDIAEAITYAYMNGASVINMSFGGSSISLAVEDALKNAYYSTVLVAAAGNDSTDNKLIPMYPASLTYVIGTMSCNNSGTVVSEFSNFDSVPYNKHEYDVYACGEQIISTWPNNKIATLSGTSMATPVVSGIAALLRSIYSDRDTFSTKYIQSQLTNTSNVHPLLCDDYDKNHSFVSAYLAINTLPKPYIYNVYDYYIFDSESLSSQNNGDFIANAGETINLGVELQNRGGRASNITLKIDTIRNNDPDITDTYIHIVDGFETISFPDIGTFSIQDGGAIYDDLGNIISMENVFKINIDQNCPNDYICNLNLTINYKNGLDETDENIYTGKTTLTLTVTNGVVLSGVISEDTVFANEQSYIIDNTLVVAENVNVTFDEGCHIQFFSNKNKINFSQYNSPTIEVYGNLTFDGSEENRITLCVSELFDGYCYFINSNLSNSTIQFNYCDITNLCNDYGNGNYPSFNHCNVTSYSKSNPNSYLQGYENGTCRNEKFFLICGDCVSSYFNLTNTICYIKANNANDCFFEVSKWAYVDFASANIMRNNVFLMKDRISDNYYPSNNCLKFNSNLENNHFACGSSMNMSDIPSIYASECSHDNYFSSYLMQFKDYIIQDNINSNGTYKLNPKTFECNSINPWPYITSITLYDSDNNEAKRVGGETTKVVVEFSSPVEGDFELYYGSCEPYSDYKIEGEFTSDFTWEGTFQNKASIENGEQTFSSRGGHAKDDEFKEIIQNAGEFGFTIDTTSAMSMAISAVSQDDGVHLTWVQDDYETLMGYNVYRSEEKDGNYTKLNTAAIPAGENEFIDDNAEPGKTYWYTFTVIKTDFTESNPAGKTSCTVYDSIAPNIYHTPVNQGYLDNNLTISCTASDNIAVTGATLYYRTKGTTEWKSLTMTKENSKYSATIFGSELSLDGLEYYISVTDGTNTITKGSADSPYTVVIKDASAISKIGDVDGDGSITTKDALMIMQAIEGEILLTDDQFKRADLNKDNVLSSFEALRILQYIDGKVTTLEM